MIPTVGIHRPACQPPVSFRGNSVICNICVNIMEVLGSSVLFKGVQLSAQEAWSHMDIKHTLGETLRSRDQQVRAKV